LADFPRFFVHNFVVANGWVTDREFADCFAVSQVVPGPNMILMMVLSDRKWAEYRVPSLPRLRHSGRHA
jgi:chromate transport protein ChrA